MRLSEAIKISDQVIAILSPHCDIINLAGSCRRESPEVKDIEIVCLPKMVAGENLFGPSDEMLRSPVFKEKVKTLGEVIKGKTDGRYMQIAMSTSAGAINLDLFMPEEKDYYRQFAIRTGSAAWTTRYIAGGWTKMGWCGSDQGLRMQNECKGEKQLDGKTKWRCVTAKSQQTIPPHWKSEEEFFKWLKLNWIEPKYRNL